jgi:hypothetical protein
LPLPCHTSPRRCAASAGSLQSLVGDESLFLGIYMIATPAVAFVFFPQVGLRMALHRSEAAADRPSTPCVGRRVAKPYLQSLCSGPSGQRWDPLAQSIDNSPRPCGHTRRTGPATRPVTPDVTSHVARSWHAIENHSSALQTRRAMH